MNARTFRCSGCPAVAHLSIEKVGVPADFEALSRLGTLGWAPVLSNVRVTERLEQVLCDGCEARRAERDVRAFADERR